MSISTTAAVYLRKEPTTDATTLQMRETFRGVMLPPKPGTHMDVVAYHDKACTRVFARWPWYYSNKPKTNHKTVMINCFRWVCQWVS